MARCQRGAKKAGWRFGKKSMHNFGSDMFSFLLGGVAKTCNNLGRVWMSLVLLSFFCLACLWVLPVLNSLSFSWNSVRKSLGVQWNLNHSTWTEIEDEKIGIISPATLGCRTPDWPCFSLSVDYEPWETARSGDYEQELWQMPGANDIFEIFKMLQVFRFSRSWISTKSGW